MARSRKQDDKIVVNNFVVCGEVLDVLNYREYNLGQENECFGYTLKIETNPETKESLDVEFFVYASSKLANGIGTVYEEVKTRARDGEGEIVRCSGKLTNNIYYSDGEIVEKLVLSGAFCNRKSNTKNKKMNFDPCAKFDTLVYVQEIKDNRIDGLVNEYSGNKIKGHIFNYSIGETAKGIEKVAKVDGISLFSGNIVSTEETVFLSEDKTQEIDTEGYFGTELERIEKINEQKRKLREEGIKVNKTHLVITGGKANIKDEVIAEQKLPYTKDDIDNMLDGIDEIIEDLENKNNVSDEEVPF